MADGYKNYASLIFYHSGAELVGGWQPDVSLCLGGKMSSTPAAGLTVRRDSAMGGVRIDRVEGACGPGWGYLDAAGPGTLRWKAPGDGDYGLSVAVAYGETMTLPSEDGEKYCVVTRVRDNDLEGTERVLLLDTFNTICGGPNFVSEAASGMLYRAGFLYNQGSLAAEITEISVEGCMWGLEEPDADGNLQEIADQYTEPIGVSWLHAEPPDPPLPTIQPGAAYGLWINNPFGADVDPCIGVRVEITYTSGLLIGLHCDQRGLTRRGQLSHAELQLHVGVDVAPDYVTPADTGPVVRVEAGDPVDIAAAGLTYDVIPAEAHVYHWAILERNPFGILSAVGDLQKKYVNADGTAAEVPPADASEVLLLAQEDGTILVSAEYRKNLDLEANRANRWLLYETFDGTAPDPAVDTPVVYELAPDLNLEHVTAALVEDTPYKVIIHTARYDEDGVKVAESVGATVYTATASYIWFSTRRPKVSYGRDHGQEVEFVEPAETVIIDAGTNTRWIRNASSTQLWMDDLLIWVLTASELRTTFGIEPGTVGGAASASVEVSGGKIYFGVAGVRQIEIDPAGTTAIERVADGDNEAAMATLLPGTPSLTRCTAVQSADYAYAGTYSFKLATSGASGTGISYRGGYGSANWKAGATYTLSGRVYIPVAATGVTYVRPRMYINNVDYYQSSITTKGSWQYFTKTVTAPDIITNENWNITLYVSCNAADTTVVVYFDAISLVETTSTPRITVGSVDESRVVAEMHEPCAVWARYGELVFPAYSGEVGRHEGAMAVDGSGVLKTDVTVVVCETEAECLE